MGETCTSGGTWDCWALASNSITTGITNSVWVVWTSTGTAATTDNIWTGWVSTTGTSSNNIYVPQQPRVMTAAEIQERDAREARWKLEKELADKAKAAAEERAEKLLIENLSLKQQLEYKQHKSFTVEAEKFRYRIRKGRVANIDVVNRAGKLDHRLCVHPAELVPDCDTMLAQKLMLEYDEDHVHRIANRHPVWAEESQRQILTPLH